SILPCLFALALACGASAQITAAVAANVHFAMEDLKADFKKSTGVDVKAVYGSSGKLSAQIKNGAPFDLFISADMDFPDSLHKWGYAPDKAKPYAYGKLVLWSLKDLDLDKGLAVLLDSGVSKVALADPERAPYGREAAKAMQRSGVHDKTRSKLVYGESIAQVSQYILTGNVDIGFTAKSVVMAGEVKGKGKWKEVDSTLYDKIAQGALVCKYGLDNNPALAARFLAYLYSEPARAIFSKYGYVLP
ncbi:MAG TPA: molybdate ABC transporter substrate-binding protein, partial [Fibrobacteria bacterium]|nr:molybdate ABC transporter substrate-binding protein [Fibrobacteria bacterium]